MNFVRSFCGWKTCLKKKSFKKIHQRIRVLRKMNNLERFCAIQKQSPKVLCYKRCLKSCKFHRKTPILESVFLKLQVSRPTTLWKGDFNYRFLIVKIPKFLRAPILNNIWKEEHLSMTASCLLQAKYVFVINCYARWSQLYISTMVL